MAENCKDINGNLINQFVFKEDGVVYGVVNYDGGATNYDTTISYNGEGTLVDITSECCAGMGFTFDGGKGKCYYREVYDTDIKPKIVFNINENNGLLFTQQEDEECGLNLIFDYLIEYDSSKLYEQSQSYNRNIVDVIRDLQLSVLIEKQVDRESVDGVYYENNKTLVSVFEQPLYVLHNLNQETGIILEGTMKDVVNNKLQTELGGGYSSNILDSHWLTADILITNPDVVSQIIDEEVKFSLLVSNSSIDFSIIMDNIELNKLCDREYVDRRTIDKVPSFNVVKTIDNKKSWVNTDKERVYELPIRETYYKTDSDRLILNSKEIELSSSIFNAIEQDIIQFMQTNTELLSGKAGMDKLWHKDLQELINTDISNLKSILEILKVLQSELVDAKTRKTLTGYPLLNLIHERYMASEGSNKYDFNKLNKFIGMLGGYWVDLIEQVIPATTIWGSTNKVGTTAFQPNKFRYRKYNMYYSHTVPADSIKSAPGVEVISKEITQLNPLTEVRNNLFIYHFSNGGDRMGRVNILGANGNNTDTNLIEG